MPPDKNPQAYSPRIRHQWLPVVPVRHLVWRHRASILGIHLIRTSVLQTLSLVPDVGLSEDDDDERPVPFPQNKVPGVDAIVQQAVRLDVTRHWIV